MYQISRHMQRLGAGTRFQRVSTCFVNQVFLASEEYILGLYNGSKPIYLHCDPFAHIQLANQLIPLIQQYGASQTAILAPSIRANIISSDVVNYLSEHYGVQIAVSLADDAPLYEQVINGKLCVSTYHQFKGNERHLVIVWGVDSGYFKYMARDLPDDTCPNGTFGALSRASKQLVVIQNVMNKPMPFVSLDSLYGTADVINLECREPKEPDAPRREFELGLLLPRRVAVHGVARHVPNEVLDPIVARHLRIEKVAAPLPRSLHIKAPDKVVSDKLKQHYEAASDLNGLAVFAAYEHHALGTLTTLGDTRGGKAAKLQALADERRRISWLLREACIYKSKLSSYKPRRIQLRRHAVRLESGKFEMDGQTTRILGHADILQYKAIADDSGKNAAAAASSKTKRRRQARRSGEFVEAIWETKFVGQLSMEHAVQAVIYAYLWSVKSAHSRKSEDPMPSPRIVLFNVRDGEKWEITPRRRGGLRSFIEDVLRAKYSTAGRKPPTNSLSGARGLETRCMRCGRTMSSFKLVKENLAKNSLN